MPNLTPLQNAFVSGELSPELYAHPNLVLGDVNIYSRGVRELVNFWTDSRGPVRSRVGFRYIGAVLADDAPPPGELCAESVYYESGSGLRAQSTKNLDYSNTLGYLVASVDPVNGLAGGQTLVVFDIATGNVVRSLGNCTRHGHKIISPLNALPNELDTLLLRTSWACGGGTRFYHVEDMTNSFNQIGGDSLSSFNQWFVAERNPDVMYVRDGGLGYLLEKVAWTDSGLNNPSGWTIRRAAGVNKVPPFFLEDSYLIAMWNGTQFGFTRENFLANNNISTPSILLNPVNGDDFKAALTDPIVVNDTDVWWIFDTQQTGKIRQYLVRTDIDGDSQFVVPAYDDQITAETGTGRNRLFHEPANNSLYYMLGDTFWRYEIDTGQYYTCTPPFDQSVVDPKGRGKSLVRIDGDLWVVLQETGVGPDTWGVEKIEAYF